MFVLLISNRLESNSGRLRNQFLSFYNYSSLAIFPVASRRPRFYIHMYTMLVHETDFVPLISDKNFLNMTPFSDYPLSVDTFLILAFI